MKSRVGMRHVWISRTAVIVMAAGLHFGPSVYAAEPVQVAESFDKYAKTTTLTTEKFNVPDVGSFTDPAFAYAWLSVIQNAGHPLSVALRVYFQRSNGWRFFDRAFDSEGTALQVDVLARDVQYGSVVAEQFQTRLSVPYLQSHRASGLDVRFDGKGGSLVVQLPAPYLQAILDRLSNNSNSAADIAPKAVQKLRLGIRYIDSTLTAKLPGSVQANLPKNGLLLMMIEAGSPAAVAGLTVGDVLIELAGNAINTPDDMTAAMAKIEAGSRVEAVIIRGGQTVRLAVQM